MELSLARCIKARKWEGYKEKKEHSGRRQKKGETISTIPLPLPCLPRDLSASCHQELHNSRSLSVLIYLSRSLSLSMSATLPPPSVFFTRSVSLPLGNRFSRQPSALYLQHSPSHPLPPRGFATLLA